MVELGLNGITYIQSLESLVESIRIEAIKPSEESFIWGMNFRTTDRGIIVYHTTRALPGFENIKQRTSRTPPPGIHLTFWGFDSNRPGYEYDDVYDSVTHQVIRIFSRSIQEGEVELRYETLKGELIYFEYPSRWDHPQS